VPENCHLLYSLTRMVGVIDGFRWCTQGAQTPLYLPSLMVSLGIGGFFLWFDLRRFRKTERSFADLISALDWYRHIRSPAARRSRGGKPWFLEDRNWHVCRLREINLRFYRAW
jgi:hypothetical protein